MKWYKIFFPLIALNLSAQNWIIQLFDSSGYCYDASIAVDTQLRPNIAYGTAEYKLKYVKWNGYNWEFQDVDIGIGNQVFTVTKLRLDRQDRPHIAYLGLNGICHCQVKYAFWNDSSWQTITIDSFYTGSYWYSAFNRQRNLDLTLNSNGSPYLSYPWINLTDSIWEVRCAYKSSDTWIKNTIWRSRFRRGYRNTNRCRIDIDTSGVPVIVFEVNSWSDSCFLYCARPRGDTWIIEEIYRYWNNASFSMYPFDLEIDTTNRFHLLWTTEFFVLYAFKQNDTWAIEWTGITIDISSNHGGLALDTLNRPHIVCSSPLTPPTYAYREGSMIWHSEIIAIGPYLLPDIALDNQENIHVCYCGPTTFYYAQRIQSGIEENHTQFSIDHLSLEVYPNPAKNYFTIRLPEVLHCVQNDKCEIKIFDVTGKLVKEIATPSARNDNNVRISLDGIKNGIYFVKVNDNNQVTKIIVLK